MQFEGGLNTNHDPRDLDDSSCQKADNVFFSNLGRLTLAHTEQQLSEPDPVSGTGQGWEPGCGLYKFLSDYDTSNGNEVEDGKEYIIRHHQNNFYSHDLSGSWSSSLGTVGSDTGVKPVYYNVDSILRIGDSVFDNSNNTRKWYGRISRSYFNAGSPSTTFEWVDANPELPIESSSAVSSRIRVSDDYVNHTPALSAGYLSMIASAVNPTYTNWIPTDSFNASVLDGYWYSKFGMPGAGGDGNYSSEINTSDEYNSIFESGSWTDDNHGGSGTTTVSLSDAASYGESGAGTKCMRFQKRYTGSEATWVRYAVALDSPIDLTDKSIYFDVYMSPHLQAFTNQIQVKWGNSIGDWNSSGNWYEQVMSKTDFPSGAWKTIEVDTSVVDNTDGTPILTAITDFAISVEVSDNDVTFGHNTTNPSYGNPNTGDFLFYNVRYGDKSSGAWEGKYKFYHTWIYDEKQESMYRYLGDNTNGNDSSNTLTLARQPLSCRIHARESGSGGFAGGNKRITGANIYYQTLDTDDAPIEDEPIAMLHVDFERGVKKFGTDDVNFYEWGNDSGGSPRKESPYASGHDKVLTFDSPPTVHTFSLNAGYKPKDFIKDIKWKCATVMNRRAYVGNVQILDERIGGNEIKRKYSDRVYKSIVNKPDIFTHGEWIDVAVNDGESVTALASYADRLLEFKEETLYIINATRSIEYLEDTHKFKGIWGQGAVCEISQGLAWVNKNGLYIYDGQNVIDVQEGLIDDIEWEGLIGEKPLISYNQRHKYLVIIGDSDFSGTASTKCIFYNLSSKTFSLMPSKGTATDAIDEGYLSKGDKSNILILKDGSLLYAQKSGSDVKFNTIKPASNSTNGVEGFEWRSKDIFFSTPHNKSTVSRVHLTYKGDVSKIDNSVTKNTNMFVNYAVNGSSSYSGKFKDITNEYENEDSGNHGGLQGNTNSEWKRIELTPTAAIKDIYSISLSIKSDDKIPQDFEVNDIALTYREKSAK